MALKQMDALAALREAAGEVIETSLCDVQGNWLALVNTEDGKRLAFAAKGEAALSALWKDVEKEADVKDVHVSVMALNANNAALVRRYVKWTAPTACGTKGASIGFSDWLGEADAVVAELFGKRQLKPVLVDFTTEDSEALQRYFVQAVDTATWGVLEEGYKEGYGANAAGLKTEEEIVKALLYGYSMIGFDCSDKIDLGIEKLSDEAVDKRFEQFNETFRAAVHASYLNAEFKVGTSKITFTENQLHRIVLEYGEAIMHIQFIYNSYLKNTPWDIDFELDLSKPGKVLTPQEHYLIGRLVHEGCDSLVYLGFDRQLKEPCFIREYYPSGLCERGADGTLAALGGCGTSSARGVNRHAPVAAIYNLNFFHVCGRGILRSILS